MAGDAYKAVRPVPPPRRPPGRTGDGGDPGSVSGYGDLALLWLAWRDSALFIEAKGCLPAYIRVQTWSDKNAIWSAATRSMCSCEKQPKWVIG